MKRILILFSCAGLLMTIGPSVLYFNGVISLEENHLFMLVGTAIWFVTAPFWINEKMKNKNPGKS